MFQFSFHPSWSSFICCDLFGNSHVFLHEIFIFISKTWSAIHFMEIRVLLHIHIYQTVQVPLFFIFSPNHTFHSLNFIWVTETPRDPISNQEMHTRNRRSWGVILIRKESCLMCQWLHITELVNHPGKGRRAWGRNDSSAWPTYCEISWTGGERREMDDHHPHHTISFISFDDPEAWCLQPTPLRDSPGISLSGLLNSLVKYNEARACRVPLKMTPPSDSPREISQTMEYWFWTLNLVLSPLAAPLGQPLFLRFALYTPVERRYLEESWGNSALGCVYVWVYMFAGDWWMMKPILVSPP